MKRFYLPSLILVLCLALCTSASAVLIGVDFGEGDPNPVNWTNGPAGNNPNSLSNLIDESGNATAVDLTYNGTFNEDVAANPFTPNASQIPSHSNSLANIGGTVVDASQIVFTFSDLTPLLLYEIYVFGGQGLEAAFVNNVTITGSGPPLVFAQTFGGSDLGELWVNAQPGSNAPLNSFALNVAASAAGQITVDVVGAGNGASIAGLAIGPASNGSAVPETGGSALLLALAVIALFGVRRFL